MTTWRSNINYVPTRPRRKVAYISDDSLGKVGFSFSAKAAQTEVGLGCLLCLLLFRVFVRPLRHSWPSSSSYTFECDVSLDKIVEVVTLPDVVVAVAVVSHGKTLIEESVMVTKWQNIGNKRKVYLFVLDPVWADSVKIPLDSDNHLLQAAVTAAAAAAMALLCSVQPLLETELLLPRRLCLWYSSNTIILSRSRRKFRETI